MADNKKAVKLVFLSDDESNIVSISIYNVTKQEYVVEDYEMDLFSKYYNADSNAYTKVKFEYALPYPADEYALTWTNAGPGEHLAYWTGKGGTIENWVRIIENKIVYDWDNPSRVESTLIVFHELYPEFITYEDIDKSQRESTQFRRTQIFDVDGEATAYTLSGDNRGSDLLQVSEDNGVTWYEPWDVRLTWGTNSPDYDDEVIIDGRFTVKFLNPPTEKVHITYVPKFNRYKLIHNLTNANDGKEFYSRHPHYFIDYSMELIP